MNWLWRFFAWFSHDPEKIALAGNTLAPSQAQALEASVKADPGNLRARTKLLGYYMMAQYTQPETRPRRAEHVLWFIEHDPGGRLAGSPFCQVLDDDPAYPRAREAWERILESSDVRAGMILNAAHFFAIPDPERTRALLERGERLDAASSAWAEQLGENLYREVSVARMVEDRGEPVKTDPEVLRKTASQALVHFERALGAATSVERRFQILPHCAQAAMEAGRWADATRYADETIRLAPRCDDERHRRDFLHWAHIVRGRGFLQSGNLDAACRELDLAGQQGDEIAPVLQSFGPDFRLARLLLESGRRAAVVAYLQRCATFWNPNRVGKWRAAIDRGEIPRMFIGFDSEEMRGQ